MNITVARVDLTQLARDLRTAGKYPDLVGAIERAAAAGSIRDDLRVAHASLDQILRLQEPDTPDGSVIVRDGDAVISGALFVQAIILYARATETKADRPKLLGEGKLTKAERATHDEAMDLRNKCIAHFGRGEALDSGPMYKEAVLFSLLLVDGRPKKQVGAFSTRTQHKVAFSARLSALLEKRLAQIAERTQDLFDRVDEALEVAGQSDEALRASLARYESISTPLQDRPRRLLTFAPSSTSAT